MTQGDILWKIFVVETQVTIQAGKLNYSQNRTSALGMRENYSKCKLCRAHSGKRCWRTIFILTPCFLPGGWKIYAARKEIPEHLWVFRQPRERLVHYYHYLWLQLPEKWQSLKYVPPKKELMPPKKGARLTLRAQEFHSFMLDTVLAINKMLSLHTL